MVLAVAVLPFAATMPARADGAAVTMRRGEHPNFSRLVFVLPDATPFSSSRRENGLTLDFPGAGPVPDAAASGRVLAVAGGQGVVNITAQPGKVCRVWQTGNRVVVDVFDLPAAQTPAPMPQPTGGTPAPGGPPAGTAPLSEAARPAPRAPVHILATAAVRRAVAPTALLVGSSMSVSASPEPVLATPLDPPLAVTPSPPPAADNGGPVLGSPVLGSPVLGSPVLGSPVFAAALLPAEAGWPSGAVLLPFGADVGAAAFGRGGEANVVFDTAQPIDLGMLRNDPAYGGLAAALLPAGTQLHFTLPATSQLRLEHAADGWRVGIVPQQPGRPPITAHADPGILTLLAASPGRVVALGDPATGGRLLVATQRTAGQPWLAPYVSAEFAILPTWQGALIQPASDRAVLRVTDTGFSLSADEGPPLAMPAAQAGQDAAGQDAVGSVVMTRRFDLPPIPAALWRSRLQQSWQDAASAPKAARFGARLRAAQAMLALGMAAEAGTMLKAAQADDPARAADLDVAALAAFADWLAGRGDPAEIARLDDPGLTGTDEISLWRALVHGDAADAAMPAAAAAATWKLVASYPEPLRQALLSPLAALLARGGKTAVLRALLQAFAGKPLDAARAALLAADNKTDEALALYRRLAASSDRLESSTARRAATELALATHRIDGRTAVQQLGQQLYAWRGGPQDLDLRMRLAALQGQTGQWRAGLALLRETEPLYPELHAQLHDAERGLVGDLIKGSAADQMAPLDLVALADECASLLAEDGADAKLAPILAAKLEALDLPERAEPVLQHILDRTSGAAPKAEVGLRLAELRLDLRGGKAALATLDASDAPDLPAALAADRTLLRARAMAAAGDADSALHLLDGLAAPAAVAMRAKLLEARHDWPAAEAALASFAKLTLPVSGALTPAQQNVLVHLASLAEQAGDAAELQSLKLQEGSRMSPGPAAELFQLLTETPVRSVTDITRSGDELTSARATPAALASLRDR